MSTENASTAPIEPIVLPPTQHGYEVRIVSVCVLPVGEPLFSEQTTRIDITDEAAGEFVTVSQSVGPEHTVSQPVELGHAVAFDRTEWPLIKAAVDFMRQQCRE